MTVRIANSKPMPSRFEYVDPLRPQFDWVDVLDRTRYDKRTWFYPWQGDGIYAKARLVDHPERIVARIGSRRTLDQLPIVRQAGLRRTATFTDFFYGRLQINPSYLDLGNILNSQSREVELWNASFEPITIREIFRRDDDGVDLSLPRQLPFTLQPLEAITIVVGVSSNGPTNLDAKFTFDVEPLQDVTLQVVGRRAVVFSIMPDTAKSYLEKMTWVTSVITAQDGTEQRASINEYPDTQISMTVQHHQETIHNLDSLLWGWQHRIYSLPLWHRHTNLSQTAFVGNMVIMCNTAYAGFREGGTVILWADFDYFETAEVVEILADRLIIRRPLLKSWGRGTLVAACRPARLPQEVSASWKNPDIASVPLTFVFTEVEQETPFESSLMYRGTPVLMIAPNWVSELDERSVRNIEIFETETKARFTVLNNDVPYMVRTQAWFLKGKDRIDQFRRWLYSRRGRTVPFWSPSWKNDLTIVSRIEAGSSTIEIQAVGYRGFYEGKEGRMDMIIILRDGRTLMRRVSHTAAGDSSATELLVLDSEIGFVIEPRDVQMVSFLGLHRLDADEVELDWRSDALVLCNQNMRLLTDGV